MTPGIQSRSWSIMGLQVSGGVRIEPRAVDLSLLFSLQAAELHNQRLRVHV